LLFLLAENFSENSKEEFLDKSENTCKIKMNCCSFIYIWFKNSSSFYRRQKKGVTRLGILFAISIIMAGCGIVSESSPGDKKTEEDYAIPVKVTRATRGNITSYIPALGTLFPWAETKISSKIPGKIEKILVAEGFEVRKGDLLIQLEDNELAIALAQAQAQLELAEAKLTNAREDWERAKRLSQQGVISQQEYDRLKSQYNIALAQWKTAQAQVKMAQTQLNNTKIRAPFSGIIVQKFANAAEQISPGLPLLHLMNISRVKAEVDVSEIKKTDIQIGQKSLVLADSYPDKIFSGKIIQIRPLVDPQSRTLKVTIAVLNEKKLLNAGMFSRVKIQAARHTDVILVPSSAITEIGAKKVAYKVNNSIAHRTEVRTGYEQDGKIEILAGIKEDDLVVTEGNYGLAHGARVFFSQQEIN
jgi:RND family efflux transporter MFP subunit